MISLFGEDFYYFLSIIAGESDKYVSAVNVPYIMSIIFLIVLVWDICHMVGVLIHG